MLVMMTDWILLKSLCDVLCSVTVLKYNLRKINTRPGPDTGRPSSPSTRPGLWLLVLRQEGRKDGGTAVASPMNVRHVFAFTVWDQTEVRTQTQ